MSGYSGQVLLLNSFKGTPASTYESCSAQFFGLVAISTTQPPYSADYALTYSTFSCSGEYWFCVPVAQLDRALASGDESRLVTTYRIQPYVRFFALKRIAD